MSDILETLVELRRITEKQDGFVMQTAFVEEVWIAQGSKAPEGFVYSPLSNGRVFELSVKGKSTMRMRAKESEK